MGGQCEGWGSQACRIARRNNVLVGKKAQKWICGVVLGMLGGDGRWLIHGVGAVPGLPGFVEIWKEWPRAGMHSAPSFLSSYHKDLEGAAVRGWIWAG